MKTDNYYSKLEHIKILFLRMISFFLISLLIPMGFTTADASTLSLDKTRFIEGKNKVLVPTKKVTITPSKKYIQVGDTFTVKAVFEPTNASYRSMIWKVKSGNAIKKVSGNKFKAECIGTATIEGYQKETNKRYRLTLKVKRELPKFDLINQNGEKISSLTLYPSSYSIVQPKYETDYYTDDDAYVFTYKTKDKAIATVSSYGVLTGKKVGSTTLVVTAPNGVKKEYKVRVEKEPAGLWRDSLYMPDFIGEVHLGGYNYAYNYANVDKTYLFTTSDEKLVLYNYLEKECALSYEVYDKSFKQIKKEIIRLPYPLGGVYLDEDGNTYVVCGQDNLKEINTNTVYAVIKYDKSMKKIGLCNITGEECNTSVPFDAGSCSIAKQGDTLVIYTARALYTSSDGLNHQSNMTFVIDAKTMKKRYVGQLYPYNHVSHSFNQFVRFDGNDIIYIDHGDAYPRSVAMQIHRNGALDMEEMNEGVYWWTDEMDLLNIVGRIGYNYTGTMIGGFETGKYNNIVAGASLHHERINEDDLIYYNTRNVYVSLISKDSNSSKLIWLTDYKEGSNITATSLRMVKINEDLFGLIYQIDDIGDINEWEPYTRFEFILIDSKGEVLARKEWDGLFAGHMQPVLFQGDIIWLKGNPYDRYYLNEKYPYNIMERIHLDDFIE